MQRIVPIISFCFCVLFASIASGQDSGQVTVLRTGDRDLQRTAFRLRICSSDLQNLREALYEAALAAPDAAARGGISQLSQHYLQLDPARAEDAFYSILVELRERAEAAATLPEFHSLTSASHPLIVGLMDLNPDLAERFEADWPDPPEHLEGSAVSGHRLTVSQLRLFRQAMEDPHLALSQLSQIESDQVDFNVRSAILASFAQDGALDAAEDLLNDTMAAFHSSLQSDPNEQSLSSLVHFLTVAASANSERVLDMASALEAIVRTLRQDGGGRTYVVNVGSETMQMTASEKLAFDAIQRLRQFPETTLRLLEAEPSLKEKLELLGGIDRALNPGPGRGEFLRQGGHSRVRRVTTALGREDGLNPESLLHAATLEGLGARELVQYLQSACFRGSRMGPSLPAPIEAIAETAAWMTLEMEDPAASAATFANLVSALARCQGEVAPLILDQGFQLLDRLRADEAAGDPAPAAAGGMQRRGLDSALRLEAALLAASAVTDFPTGMARIRAVEDPVIRYRAMIAFIETYLFR